MDALGSGPVPLGWASWQRQETLWEREGLQRRARHVYKPLEEISGELVVAVLVGEDINFFSHSAVDPKALKEVFEQWRKERRLRGGSTISQQVAKMLYLSGERSWVRKARELRLASRLERRLGKRRVLEVYLNIVEFGPGLFGVEVASHHYFGVGAGELTTEQAAALAAAIPAPGRDNPQTATAKWQFRRDTIARRMHRVDWLRALLAARRVGVLSPPPTP
jgi:monofunctional biosynthetic peptidoglycan transglycosylase